MAIGQSPDDGARFSIDVTKARDTGLYQYDATLTIYNSNGDVIKTVGPFPASAEPDPKLVGGIGVVESGQKTIADGSYAGTVQMGLYDYKADDRYGRSDLARFRLFLEELWTAFGCMQVIYTLARAVPAA